MADFTYAGHLPPDPVADYRDNRLAQWASRDLDTLFFAARAHASLTNGRAPPPTSLPRAGTDPMSTLQPFHNGVSAKVANHAASLAAVGEHRRAMEALDSNPIASGRGVHEELSRLHQQDNDDLADVLPDPFSFPRIKLHASEVDTMEVVARCPRKSSTHVYGWRFETLRALGSPCTFTGLAEAIANAEVPRGVASFLASATLLSLDKLDLEQRRAQEHELRDQKGTLRPVGVGSVLVGFANRALLAVIGDQVSQWLASRYQFGVGVRGGVEIVQFMLRAALVASPDTADMQGDAPNALNELLRRPLFEECLQVPHFFRCSASLLCCIAVHLPCTFTTYQNAHGPPMRIPSPR
jgi:hypothetical protein